MDRYGIVLLAAGASARLGRPKQLLQYQGKSLMGQALATAMQSDASAVVVVVGAYADALLPELGNFAGRIVFNPGAAEGIASSICCGLAALDADEINGVIFMVCDQPHVSPALVNELISKGRENEGGIVACTYSDTAGVPALFSKKYFPELLQLKGNEGAKKLLKQYVNNVITVPFSAGATDIDTVSDYEKLLATKDTGRVQEQK